MTALMVFACVYSAVYLGYCDYKDMKKQYEAEKEELRKFYEGRFPVEEKEEAC